MNDAFWAGFQKEANYDYAHERKEFADENKHFAGMTPPTNMDYALKGLRAGIAVGGLAGLLSGASGGKGGALAGAGLGALLGSAAGAGGGALLAGAQRKTIADSQRIESLPKKEREAYYLHLAREDDMNRVNRNVNYNYNV